MSDRNGRPGRRYDDERYNEEPKFVTLADLALMAPGEVVTIPAIHPNAKIGLANPQESGEGYVTITIRKA